MATKKVSVTIKGKTPLLMHAYPMMEIEALEKKSKEEQAEYAAYRDQETNDLYIPGINVQRCMIAGATYSKGKGRASLQKQVAACVMIMPEKISLNTQTYKIDSRPVVIPSTKGRIIRHRPRLDNWEASFMIEFDDTLLTEIQVNKVLQDSLDRVGLLDFRPEKKGMYGRAIITKWKVS